MVIPKDLPCSPVVKTLSFQAGDMHSVPGRETKIPHATGCSQKIFLKRKRQIITPFIAARKTPSLTQIYMSSKYSSPPFFVIPGYLPKSNMVWLYLWSTTLFTGFCNPSHTILPKLKSESKSAIVSSPDNFLLLWFHYFFYTVHYIIQFSIGCHMHFFSPVPS